jgi:hypothetical protein
VDLRKVEVEMSENLAEHYTLPTSQEVEDEITEQRSIIVSAHVQSGAYLGQPRGQAKPGVGKDIAGELHQG